MTLKAWNRFEIATLCAIRFEDSTKILSAVTICAEWLSLSLTPSPWLICSIEYVQLAEYELDTYTNLSLI